VPQIGLVIDGGDQFFRPIERELGQHYQVRRFAPRFVKAPVVGTSVNKLLLHLQLAGFLRRYDLVFFEWAGSLLVRATQMPKTCKIVARLHSVEVVTAAHLVDWSRVDATIVPSGHMKRRLLQVAGVSPPSLYVVNYGVDLARFQPVARTFKHRIGMVCAVLPIKRVYEAILCVADLVRQGHPFTLDVAGRLDSEGAERYPWAVRELIEKLDLTDRITLHGHLDDPSQFYHDVGIFLSNSYWEGQQVALLEAMASGCFCLSHFWGGVEEVLPAEKIYTTDADLRAKLLAYVALPEARRQRAQARMRAIAEERFDERRMVGEILGLIEGAVGE
jgi:glycosyltransferase involved in cell wall biosynthesis